MQENEQKARSLRHKSRLNEKERDSLYSMVERLLGVEICRECGCAKTKYWQCPCKSVIRAVNEQIKREEEND